MGFDDGRTVDRRTMLVVKLLSRLKNSIFLRKSTTALKIYFYYRLSNQWYFSFLIIYVTIAVIGFLSNSSIIILSIINNVQANTRNIFILNLALSDIVLCMVTIPLTCMDILHDFWPIDTPMVIYEYCNMKKFDTGRWWPLLKFFWYKPLFPKYQHFVDLCHHWWRNTFPGCRP